MKKVLEKLLRIMNGVKVIPKRGYNAAQKYNFVMGNDVDEHIREALVAEGLAFTTTVKELKIVPAAVPVVGDKVVGETTYVLLEFTITDLESGESLVSQYWGAGKDTGDKGIYKAYTGAIKYFWMKTLMIPSELTDPEVEEPQPPVRKAQETSRVFSEPRPSVPPEQTQAAIADVIAPASPQTMYKFKHDWSDVDVETWVFNKVIKSDPRAVEWANIYGQQIPFAQDKTVVRSWIKSASGHTISEICNVTGYSKEK